MTSLKPRKLRHSYNRKHSFYIYTLTNSEIDNDLLMNDLDEE